MSLRLPTPEEIRAYRVEQECGLVQARKALTRQALMKATQEAKTVGDLKEVMLHVLEDFVVWRS